MREGYIVSKILKSVRQKYPTAYCRKLSDRFTRGLPDVLIVCNRHTGSLDNEIVCLFVETKTADGRLSPIQRAEAVAIHLAGASVIVARDVATVLAKLEEMGAVS